jgi:hypothetical protein
MVGLVDAGVKTPVYLRFVFLGSVVSQVSSAAADETWCNRLLWVDGIERGLRRVD